MKIIGVDVGGTFTDLLLLDEERRQVNLAKVPTTLDNQAFDVVAAVERAGARLGEIGAVIHGTTTTTNALLERKVARTGLVTTRGFRDVLELGRRTRPKLYGLIGTFEPLIPRELRLEVTERIDAEGTILRPLDEAELRDAVARLRDLGCEALVIHFLHSYVNPAHETRAAEIARELWPNPYITVGAALGLDAEAAAAAILRIANDKMAGAIRMVSLACGHDPRRSGRDGGRSNASSRRSRRSSCSTAPTCSSRDRAIC